MPLSSLPAYTAVQIAFIVPDIDEAMPRYSALAGYGPWLVLRRISVPAARYRGRPATFVHSAALAQAGPVQVELIQQHDDEPSVYRELVAAGDTGFHHTALFVADFAAAIEAYAAVGFDLAQD